MNKNVVVLGLGYVGLPSVLNHSLKGYNVFGFDIDYKKIEYLNQGISYLDTLKNKDVKKMLENGVIFTNDSEDLFHKDIYIIDVPTPINEYKIPDLSYVQSAVGMIVDKVAKGSLIILESTTYPGTTEKFIVQVLSEKGFTVGEDIYVAYSPERIDPGNTFSIGEKIPRIVSGYSSKCLEKAIEFYGVNIHVVDDLKIAELAKIYENTFRLVNIALADEIHKISDALEINISSVIEAAATKPFGFMKFTPNLGIGGHCIPVDPYYITWLMEQFGVETPLISAAGAVNDSMLDFHLEKIKSYIEKNISSHRSKIKCAILGMAYKKNIADTRMSSVVSLIKKMNTMNFEIVIYDDVIYSNQIIDKHEIKLLNKRYSELKQYDIVIYAVDHDFYSESKKEIIENSSLFYDLTTV